MINFLVTKQCIIHFDFQTLIVKIVKLAILFKAGFF